MTINASYNADWLSQGTSFARNLSGKPQPRQISYYYDLCRQRGITPKNVASMTYDDLSSEIQRVMSLATLKQKEKIRELITELQNAGHPIQTPSDEFMDNLTGGQNGTASALIQSLFDEQRKWRDNMPPRDEQVANLVEWLYCVDIPFEEYGVSRKFELDFEIEKSDGTKVKAWRWKTGEEFASELKEKLSAAKAQEIYERFRGVAFDWKGKRITRRQANMIRELEADLANIEMPREVEYAIVNGEIVQIYKKVEREYAPTAYNPLSDDELRLMTKEDADRYIDMLRSERDRRGQLGKPRNQQEEAEEAEISPDKDVTFESIRQAQHANEWAVREFTALNDLVHAMFAMAGFDDDDVKVVPYHGEHDLVKEVQGAVKDIFFNATEGVIAEKRNRIKDFMLYVLEEGYVKPHAMKKMCEASDTAKQMFFEICKDNEEILMNLIGE